MNNSLTRRDVLKTGLAACAIATSAKAATTRPSRPNFIVILTDDQRHDALRCAGNPHIHTPNLDALAKRGVRFTHAFAATSICSPSRAAILTGRYGSANGVTGLDGTIRAGERTWAHLLKQAGYRTAKLSPKCARNRSAWPPALTWPPMLAGLAGSCLKPAVRNRICVPSWRNRL